MVISFRMTMTGRSRNIFNFNFIIIIIKYIKFKIFRDRSKVYSVGYYPFDSIFLSLPFFNGFWDKNYNDTEYYYYNN
jgi:hypothetical protein